MLWQAGGRNVAPFLTVNGGAKSDPDSPLMSALI